MATVQFVECVYIFVGQTLGAGAIRLGVYTKAMRGVYVRQQFVWR